MLEIQKYYPIDISENVTIRMHSDFVMARYNLALNEHRLLHLLLAQKKADQLHFLPYIITSKDWAIMFNSPLSTANITMKRLTRSFNEKLLSFEQIKYPELSKVFFVEFIKYDRGTIYVKLNDQIAPFVA